MLIYTDLVREIIEDIAAKVTDFSHLEPDAIALAATTRWAGSKWGSLATCIGLERSSEPTFSVWIRSRTKTIVEVSPWFRHTAPEILHGDRMCRYLILLRLPRLLEQNPLETIVHELFHIGERSDGLLRPMRHGKLFDWSVKRLMRAWLERADPSLAQLSQMRFVELQERFGTIVAHRLPPQFRMELIEPTEAPSSYEEAVKEHYPGHRLLTGYRIHPIKFTTKKTPRRIDSGDYLLRYYHADGSQDVPLSTSRYLKAQSTVISDLP